MDETALDLNPGCELVVFVGVVELWRVVVVGLALAIVEDCVRLLVGNEFVLGEGGKTLTTVFEFSIPTGFDIAGEFERE